MRTESCGQACRGVMTAQHLAITALLLNILTMLRCALRRARLCATVGVIGMVHISILCQTVQVFARRRARIRRGTGVR